MKRSTIMRPKHIVTGLVCYLIVFATAATGNAQISFD
jgi:hypothetical protein